jgi:predicted DNA-binding antitoxin AbrB/MazE fold protein
MKTIPAVFEQGVFRPLEKVELPENTQVEVRPLDRPENPPPDDNLKAIYAIMSRRFRSGRPDLAARHNDHQP